VVCTLGAADFPSGRRHVLWDGGTLRDLQSFGANDLNERGEIAGTQNGRAAVWKDDVVTDLNRLPGRRSPVRLLEAHHLNDRGQVICYGRPAGYYLVSVD
jgi:hypothetical protein